nr:hypothetical protein C5F59_06900 [Streptomyces sp. QL37]
MTPSNAPHLPSWCIRTDGSGPWQVESSVAPQPGPGEVLVEVHAFALSESDWTERDTGMPAVGRPLVREWDWAGRVVSTGPGVSPELVGQNTVAREALEDRTISSARPAKAGTATDVETRSRQVVPGLLTGHLAVSRSALQLLPDGTDLAAAALLGRASVAAEVLESAEPKAGERVAIFGAGAVGLLLVQLLSLARPCEVVVIDPSPERGALALAAGATRHCRTLDAARVANVFDVVVDTTGTAAAPGSACLLAARSARVVFTRTFPEGTPLLDRTMLALRELSLLTATVATSRAWYTAVRAFDEGLIDSRPLIAREIPVASLADGAACAGDGSTEALVTVLLST